MISGRKVVINLAVWTLDATNDLPVCKSHPLDNVSPISGSISSLISASHADETKYKGALRIKWRYWQAYRYKLRPRDSAPTASRS